MCDLEFEKESILNQHNTKKHKEVSGNNLTKRHTSLECSTLKAGDVKSIENGDDFVEKNIGLFINEVFSFNSYQSENVHDTFKEALPGYQMNENIITNQLGSKEVSAEGVIKPSGMLSSKER